MAAPTFISSAGPAGGTTSISGLNYSATRAANDLDIVGIIYEGASSNTATLSGWGAKILSATGGSMFIDVYAKVAQGNETGGVGTISITGATDSLAAIATYRSSTGRILVGPAVSGADVTSGTAYSATTGTIQSLADSLLVYIFGQSGTGTHSGRTFTQSGATLGTLTARFGAAGSSTRQEFGDRPVTVGANAAIVHGCTLAAAATGITGVIRLDEAPPFAAFGVAA